MSSNTTALQIWHRFNRLLNNLTLKPRQQEDGTTKHRGVREVLNYEYYGIDSVTANSMLVGSWGKGTAIRPPRDIDVLFVLPYEVYERYQRRFGNRQSQLLQEVKAKLLKYYGDTDIGGDGQVVSVPFASYAVEVVPAFLLKNGQYWICDTNSGGRYRTTDPKAERTALNASDRASAGNTRDLIRMLKCWQDVCNVPLKSFWLEILARAFVDQWAHRGCARQLYPYLVQNFFAWLRKFSNGTVMAPGTGERMGLGDAWATKVEMACTRSTKALRYDRNGDHDSAGVEWQKIFGTFVPM